MRQASRSLPHEFAWTFRDVHRAARGFAAQALRGESSWLRRMTGRALIDKTPSEYPYIFLVSYGVINRLSTRLAACIHLFQTSTFVFDDILDRATVRNHGPSIVARDGVSGALIVGQLLQAIAMERFQALARATAGRGDAATAAFLSTVRTVYCGQYRDLRSVGRVTLSLREYQHMVDQTTGAFLGNVAHAGAIMGGRSYAQVDHFREYARAYGMALQASDDILDVTGTPAETGKQRGMDLRARKPRLPFLMAMRSPNKGDRRALRAYMTASRPRPRGFERSLRTLRAPSVIQRSTGKMDYWLGRAHARASRVSDSASRHRLLWLLEALPRDQGVITRMEASRRT
ncbi:MAG TPA: polyprenyl synthetase family protein [Candidatus Eisenbacteria bacterium]|nr:polyprenyl synthetase family protein [Candidatus Eisenbacteria bacterium]